MTPGRPMIHVVGAAIMRGGRCLVARRGPSMRLAGKWEFPGGKVEGAEAPETALVREIEEELAIQIVVGDRLGRGFDVTDDGRTVQLDVYAADWVDGTMRLTEHDAAQWYDAAALPGLDWPVADRPIVPIVAARLAANRSP